MATLKLSEKSLAQLAAPTDAAQAYYWDTELRGFGAIIGRTGRRTFVVRARVSGELVKRTIGAFGQPRGDGHLWTVQLARIEARKLLGQMADGKDPLVELRRSRATGPTLREGFDLHIANMEKRGRAERSIKSMRDELPRLLADWMARPIAELTGIDLAKIHTQLTDERGPYIANRIVAYVSAIWNALDRLHELPGRNPARAVTRNPYRPSRERIDDQELPSWYEKVLTLSPVRRDLQLFCLFTGMRSDAARQSRWEHIDEDTGALHVPNPKGGERRAFTLPLPPTLIAMLEKRRQENRDMFGPWGGDHGWIFPALTRDTPQEVIPLAEPKEYRLDPTTKRMKPWLPGLHALRRTYLSVAAEAGVSELDRHVLANHAFGRQNVNATYIRQAFDHLAECQGRIETALWARIKPDPATAKKKRGNRHLMAV